MNYLVIMLMLGFELGSLDSATSNCALADISSTDLSRPDETKNWSSYICAGIEGGQIVVLISPVENSSMGNCIYKSMTLGRRSNQKWEPAKYKDKAYMITRNDYGQCPEISSTEYASVNAVHPGDEREKIYMAIIAYMKNVFSRDSDIDEALSSVPLLDRLFDSTYQDFKKAIKGSIQSDGPSIEVIDRDFRGSGYFVLIRAQGNVWNLSMSEKEGDFRITGVSKLIE